MSQEQSGGVGQPTGTVKAILPSLVTQQFQPIKYYQKAALVLGITQIILGIICIISNILLLVTSMRNYFSTLGYGIGGGILFNVAGFLEVLSANKTSNLCLTIGSMVMSIIAACASAIVFGFGIVEAVFQRYSSYGYMSHDSVAYAVIMTASAVAESVISIICSAFNCCTVYRALSSIMPITVNMDGNQLVKGNQPTNSYYQALAKPQN